MLTINTAPCLLLGLLSCRHHTTLVHIQLLEYKHVELELHYRLCWEDPVHFTKRDVDRKNVCWSDVDHSVSSLSESSVDPTQSVDAIGEVLGILLDGIHVGTFLHLLVFHLLLALHGECWKLTLDHSVGKIRASPDVVLSQIVLVANVMLSFRQYSIIICWICSGNLVTMLRPAYSIACCMG